MINAILGEHFQMAYVVRDIQRAIDRLDARLGLREWRIIDLPEGGSNPGARRLAVAYSNNMMFELVEPRPEVLSLYSNWLTDDAQEMRFHHAGFLLEREDFDRAIGRLTTAGYPSALAGATPLLDFNYIDTTAELGHYCELICPNEGGKTFFASIPRN